MFPIRRAALRLLSAPSTSFVSKSRALSTFSSSPLRIPKATVSLHFQKRWATNEAEAKNEDEAPVSKLQPTAQEEVENAISSDNAAAATESAPTDEPPAMAETANLTEATEETQQSELDFTDRYDNQSEGQNREQRPQRSQRTPRGAPRDLVARENSPKKTVYVGNLFFDVTEDDISKELSRFGTIESIRLIRDARGLSKGFGYVGFENVDQATRAIAGLNQQVFEGRRLSLQYATTDSPPRDRGSSSNGQNSGPRNPPSKTLFIGNMSWEMTDRDLNNLFRGIRNVIDVRVAIDRRTGQPRGFAHADFIDIKSAMEGEKTLQGKEVYGRQLRIDYSYASSSAPRNQARDEGQDGRRDGRNDRRQGSFPRRSEGREDNSPQE